MTKNKRHKKGAQHKPKVSIQSLQREVDELRQQFHNWTADNAFVHWFLQAFLVADRDVAAKAVTGVSHDKGIDAVLIDDSASKVFLLQGKYRLSNRPVAENRQEVISFCQLAQVLPGPISAFRDFCDNLDPRIIELLSDARERICKRRYSLSLYYVTTGRCSAALKTEAEHFASQSHADCDISVLDRNNVLSLLVDYLGGAAPPVPFLDLQIDTRGHHQSDGCIQRVDKTTDIAAWILTMNGKDVGELYKKAGDRLFARNIRGFLGETAINEGMHSTLVQNPEFFWYYNNGVTIICDSARLTSERNQTVLRVTNPQVINGQQTTRVLAKTPSKQASVLLRVLSVPRRQRTESDFEELVSNIVAATNWQNAILRSDLRSNDAVQVGLQRDLAKFGYYYIRKRQSKKEARRALGANQRHLIKKEVLAQVVGACDLDPYEVRGGKEGLFERDPYRTIFDSRPIRQYLAIYWLGRAVKKHASGYPDRAYAKWHVLHFMWAQVQSLVRSRASADYFIKECECSRPSRPLDRAINLVYLAALDFYRKNRGSGSHAVDVSNFFYRRRQHTAFQAFWMSRQNSRRQRFAQLLTKFEATIKQGDNG